MRKLKKAQLGGQKPSKVKPLQVSSLKYVRPELIPEANPLDMVVGNSANTYGNAWRNFTTYFFEGNDGTLMESPYKPSKGANSKKYYIRPGMKEDVYTDLTSEKVMKDYNHTGEFSDIHKALLANGTDRKHNAENSFAKNKAGYKGMYNLGSPGKMNRGQFNFGRYTVDAGQDDRGRYISFNDTYDWNGIGGNNPIPFYGRIYENEWNTHKQKLQKKQKGGVIQNSNPLVNLVRNTELDIKSDPKKWMYDYMNSELFKDRLNKAGLAELTKQEKQDFLNTNIIESDDVGTKAFTKEVSNLFINEGLNKLKRNVNNVSISKNLNKNWDEAYSEYDPTLVGYNNTPSSALTHELSHIQRKLSSGEEAIINGLSKNENSNYHDVRADEKKADLDALRYMMFKKGIYDPSKEDMNIKHFNKAKKDKDISKEATFQRLLKSFTPDNLINFNNFIASENNYPTQEFYKNGGNVSTKGYKKNSPDVNNPYNIIPSGNITMQDVEFPVFGYDNYGNQQLMYPGNDYQFPGDYVTEIPLKKCGGEMKKLRKKQFGGEDIEQQGITPFYSYQEPWTDIVTNDGGTQPPSNTKNKNKRMPFNQFMNIAGNNLMYDLTNPFSFQNMSSYLESGVNFFDNRRRNKQQEEWLALQRNSDNMYRAVPGNDRGDYVNTGSANGLFRPDQMGFNSPGMYQKGGQVKPTSADSAALYNNSKNVIEYYNKSGRYGRPNDALIKRWAKYDHEEIPVTKPIDGLFVPMKDGTMREATISPTQYYRNLNQHQYYQKENAVANFDTRTPMILYDRRIKPDKHVTIQNQKKGDVMEHDVVDMHLYTPSRVKPWHLLSDQEKQVRMKQQPKTETPVNKPSTNKRRAVAPQTVTGADVYPEIPADLEWHDGLVPTENINRYGYGVYGQPNLQQKTMSADELDYIRKALNAPQLYRNGQTRDQLRGSDTGAEVEALLKKYREGKNLPKQEYGGQTGFSLDLKHRYKIYPDEDPRDLKLSNYIKEVDREDANIEAEKGETVFGDFDNDGIFEHMEIGGKKHYEGGTPLDVPLDSFIFSDAKKLKIGGEILESFGKPEGTKSKYTPAQLAKQYKINKYKNVLEDPKIDDPIKLRTAELMIDNYNKKLSKLALVQESMKGFPNGIPQVSLPYLESIPMGTDETTPDAQQLFKMGGSLPKALYGDLPEEVITDPYAGGKTQAGRITPTGKNNKYNRPNSYLETWDQIIPGVSALPNKEAQALIYDYTLKNNPAAIDNMWTTYGLTAKGMNNKNLRGLSNNGKFTPESMTPQNRAKLKDAYVDGFFGVRQLDPTINTNSLGPSTYTRPNPQAEVDFKQPIPNGLQPNSYNPSTGTYDPTGFWTQDKINNLAAISNRANLRKYLPWQAPVIAENLDPTFYDPTRELAANAEMVGTQMNMNAQFSGPQSLGSRNSEVAGNSAVNAANILGRYNNQNVGVANQFETMNTEINNRVYDAEAQRANNLYNGTVIANAQFDNERSQANDVIRRNLVNALTNSQKTQWMNELYPQFNLDPSSGRFYFDKGKPFNQGSATRSSGESNNYIDLFNRLKRENPSTPDDVIKKQVEQMIGVPARNTVDNQGNMRSTYYGQVPEYLNTISQMFGGQ